MRAIETSEDLSELPPEQRAKAILDFSLCDAAYRGKVQEVRQFLAKGADPKARPDGESCALDMALAGGSFKCVKELAPLSDLDGCGPSGMTALMHAAREDFAKAAALLATPARARAGDSQGRDALMWAARSGSAACLPLLAGAGDPRARDHDGHDALAHAIRRNDLEMVKLLAPISGADARDKDGRLPSDLARLWGGLKIHKFLRAGEEARAERREIEEAAGSGSGKDRGSGSRKGL